MRSKPNKTFPRAPTLPDEGLVRERQVLKAIPVSPNTWRRGVEAGKYPKPVWISKRIKAWKVEDIRELVATLAATPVVLLVVMLWRRTMWM